MKIGGKLYRLAIKRTSELNHELERKSAAVDIAISAGDQTQAKSLETEMDRLARNWAAWDQLREYAKERGL